MYHCTLYAAVFVHTLLFPAYLFTQRSRHTPPHDHESSLRPVQHIYESYVVLGLPLTTMRVAAPRLPPQRLSVGTVKVTKDTFRVIALVLESFAGGCN